MPIKPPALTIITGLSGAGMSSVLKTLEDFGYEVFDNFPLFLLESLVRERPTDQRPMAVGIDVRSRGFTADALLARAKPLGAQIVFVTCEDTVLERRFTETRRRHPLAATKTVAYGIAQERALLQPLQDEASIIIDTTDFTVHDLRHQLGGYFQTISESVMNIALMSFAYRRGVPRQADLVFDVRFLKNPHWDTALRPLTGEDPAVGAFIRTDPDFVKFDGALKALLDILMPRYVAEGKTYLTIGFGCSGGKHRSVFMVEHLATWLADKGFTCSTMHRDR